MRLVRRGRVLLVLAVVALTGCSSRPAARPAPSPSLTVDSRPAALMGALRDKYNVDPAAWAGVSEDTAVAHAKAVCADLDRPMPLADVWQAEMKRDGVSMSDADYFTRASAHLYCPQLQRTAGYLG